MRLFGRDIAPGFLITGLALLLQLLWLIPVNVWGILFLTLLIFLIGNAFVVIKYGDRSAKVSVIASYFFTLCMFVPWAGDYTPGGVGLTLLLLMAACAIFAWLRSLYLFLHGYENKTSSVTGKQIVVSVSIGVALVLLFILLILVFVPRGQWQSGCHDTSSCIGVIPDPPTPTAQEPVTISSQNLIVGNELNGLKISVYKTDNLPKLQCPFALTDENFTVLHKQADVTTYAYIFSVPYDAPIGKSLCAIVVNNTGTLDVVLEYQGVRKDPNL